MGWIFRPGTRYLLDLGFHRLVVADDRARQHEHEPEDRPQDRFLRSREIHLFHARVKRQNATLSAEQVQYLSADREDQTLGGRSVDVHVRRKAGATELPHLSHIVGGALHGLVLGTRNVAALPDVQHDAFMAGGFQMLFQKFDAHAPTRPRGRIGRDLKDLGRSEMCRSAHVVRHPIVVCLDGVDRRGCPALVGGDSQPTS